MRVAPAIVEAPFATALVELGERRTDLVVLSADLSKYTDLLPFAEAFPDRFVQVGMAEQNMMGVAGGLAKTGFLPIAVTYGVFATRRAYDQVAMAMTTGPSRGIVVAFLPGITTPFKATHQAIDDVAIMRALPGMTVIDPADATELAAALAAAVEHDGTVYMRGLRGAVAQLFDPVDFQFHIGAPRELLAGDAIGLAGSGLGTQWAMEAAELLGAGVGLLHVPTLKPLDIDSVASFCSRFDVVTTVENHSVVGGLAAAIAEVVTREGLGTRIKALGVPDRWEPAGSLPYIRAQLELDAEGIARSAVAA